VANINRVIIAGNLTRDPQVRFLASEQAVANFGLAINRKFKGSDGSLKEETTFVDVEAWGRQAELVGQYLTKGRGCLVEGRLKLDSWEDKEGKKQSKLRVVAENVQFLDSRPRQGGGPGEGPAGEEPAGDAAPAQPSARPARPAPSSAPADDEPPF
jgi:single-strand DNA-binding protein